MKLIVGLGNPGKQYEQSRHNVGYRVVELLASRWSIGLTKQKHSSQFGSGFCGAEQVVLLKPQTYMNLSGESVAGAVVFYKLSVADVLVVVDDTALELGHLRLRGQGSAGGHNGLRDIISRLGRDDFARLRIGIGGAGTNGAVGHVLGSFGKKESAAIESAIESAATVVECWLAEGIELAMTRYNVRNRKDQEGNAE